jgi:hypothetical protein
VKDGKRNSGMATCTAMTGRATQTRERVLWTLTDQLICSTDLIKLTSMRRSSLRMRLRGNLYNCTGEKCVDWLLYSVLS